MTGEHPKEDSLLLVRRKTQAEAGGEMHSELEKVLPGVDLYIDASDGSTQKILPLDSFVTTDTTVNGGAAE